METEIMKARVEMFCDADRRAGACEGMTDADASASAPTLAEVMDVLMGQ